ncbi:MAG TPA: DUF2336 domain-containing protein [Xanthobacteraceae bacterium]|nr:DUF2336 domain-containing protein [Xanthobacteraceae bacterium]
MIVRQFLCWIQTAPPGDRADATSALARAYLYSDLSNEDRLAATAAMTVLLDDPSPLVRQALAEALASSREAPHGVILGLVRDQTDIAEIVAARSPVLNEGELIDLISGTVERVQCAVASRAPLSRSLAAAIAEIGSAAACLTLIENPDAELTGAALARIAERHGHLAAVREPLLAREDLAIEIRQALVAKLSDTLARFVAHREWLPEERAHDIAREACDRVTVAIAAETNSDEVSHLVRHLVTSGQLTGGLMLRALLAGNVRFLIEALAELSGLKPARVEAIVSDRSGHGFRALYDKAGLPDVAYRAFRAALEVIFETGFADDMLGHAVLRRRIVERVLVRYEEAADGELDHLLALLRKLAAEAAREEARIYTADLVAAA